MQPRSEAYEIEDRCFRVSVARRLMLPHPVAANPADVVQFCPNKSAAGVICNKPLDPPNNITATAVAMVEVSIADMQHWPDVLRISYTRTAGSKYILNKKYLPLLVSLTDKLNTLGWTLSLNFMVRSRIWTSLSLLPSLAIRLWWLLPAQNQVLWPRERRRPNSIGTHTSILSRSFLRQLADLAPHARKFINYLLRDADNPPIAVRDTWSTIQSVLHSAISKQQLMAAVT